MEFRYEENFDRKIESYAFVIIDNLILVFFGGRIRNVSKVEITISFIRFLGVIKIKAFEIAKRCSYKEGLFERKDMDVQV